MDKWITVLGKPEGKARPRVVNRGGFARTYTPEQTVLYENYIKLEYRAQEGQFYEQKTYLKLILNVYFGIPKSISKSKYSECLNNIIRPAKKPDIDNIAKVYMDALNGVAYSDDSQIITLQISKFYSDKPRVEFKLEVLNG